MWFPSCELSDFSKPKLNAFDRQIKFVRDNSMLFFILVISLLCWMVFFFDEYLILSNVLFLKTCITYLWYERYGLMYNKNDFRVKKKKYTLYLRIYWRHLKFLFSDVLISGRFNLVMWVIGVIRFFLIVETSNSIIV